MDNKNKNKKNSFSSFDKSQENSLQNCIQPTVEFTTTNKTETYGGTVICTAVAGTHSIFTESFTIPSNEQITVIDFDTNSKTVFKAGQTIPTGTKVGGGSTLTYKY